MPCSHLAVTSTSAATTGRISWESSYNRFTGGDSKVLLLVCKHTSGAICVLFRASLMWVFLFIPGDDKFLGLWVLTSFKLLSLWVYIFNACVIGTENFQRLRSWKCPRFLIETYAHERYFISNIWSTIQIRYLGEILVPSSLIPLEILRMDGSKTGTQPKFLGNQILPALTLG